MIITEKILIDIINELGFRHLYKGENYFALDGCYIQYNNSRNYFFYLTKDADDFIQYYFDIESDFISLLEKDFKSYFRKKKIKFLLDERKSLL